MSRTFRYIQNDDVLKSFSELRDSVLRERPVVIARHGDYTLMLKYISDHELGLEIKDTERKRTIEERSYDINDTTNDLVSRGVRHACQKMGELSDEDVNRKRLQIWKWYIAEWQKDSGIDTVEMAEKELNWHDEGEANQQDLLDMESFLHGEYLNLGHTISLIEKYLANDSQHLDQFRRFAINDIMEMTGEDTKDKSLAEAEKKRHQEGMKKHTYRFTVSVEATDKEHARQALLSYLAGDERIRIQK